MAGGVTKLGALLTLFQARQKPPLNALAFVKVTSESSGGPMLIRSLFITAAFSALALGCAENQFVPVNDESVLASDIDGESYTNVAEDGEYEVITPDSLSSGGKSAKTDKSQKVERIEGDEHIPDAVFDDYDFGIPKTGGIKSDPGEVIENSPIPKATPTPGKEDEEEDEDGELPTLDVAKSTDVSMKGRLRPTVYYYPVINEDRRKCSAKSQLIDSDGKRLARVCEATRASCRLQGSCAIIQKGKKRTFNIKGQVDGIDRFFETTKDACRYGYGVKSSCLDPFYTVAADLNIYRPGDVIYVPVVRGIELPDGSKHSGYFIVRDRGRNIIGKTRFDFFTGHISWRDDENPFTKAGLANKANKFEFMKIKGKKAQTFSELRSYPKLPVDIVKH